MHSKKLTLIIFVISLLATVGSLYYGYFGDPVTNIMSWDLFNRINGLPACDLCWYMRVFQYPVVIISGLALLYKDNQSIRRSVFILSSLWLIVGVYKQLLEWWVIQESLICTSSVSCAIPQVAYFWWIGLPLFGIISFLISLVCSILLYRIYRHDIT